MTRPAIALAAFLLCVAGHAQAQSIVPRVEVGALFSHVRLVENGADAEFFRQYRRYTGPIATYPETAFGGRLAISLTRWLAVETEFTVAPRRLELTYPPGEYLSPSVVVGLEGNWHDSEKLFLVAGARVGHRFGRVELFGRAMPGMAQIGLMPTPVRIRETQTSTGPIVYAETTDDYYAKVVPGVNLGGGAAFALSPRTRLRFDVGDMVLWYRFPLENATIAYTRHNVQFGAGVSVGLGAADRGVATNGVDHPAGLRAWKPGVSVGFAVSSPVGHHLGVTPDRNHLIVGLQARRPFLRRGRWTGTYAPEVVPALVVSNNPSYDVETVRATDGRSLPHVVERGRGPVVGFGLMPFALETAFQWTRRWAPYGAAGIGCVWFTRDVPVLDARRFNITFEWGGGVVRTLATGRAVRFGYKFHHLSNDFTAPANPGIDAHVFVIGFGWSAVR